MTRRGGEEASERSWIGEDERQPVMARLAARWRRSNLVILVNLTSSEDTCLEKERVRSRVTTRKVGVGLKRRRESSKRRLGWRLAWWGSIEKKEASQLLGLRVKTPVLRPALQSKQSSLCGLHRSRDLGGGGPNGQIVSVKRAAVERSQRSRKIFNEEREKYRAKNRSLWNTSTDSKGTAFVILIDHTSLPVRRKRLSPTSKARRKASRNQFVEKGGMPDRVESFREIDSRQDRPKAGLGLLNHPKWTEKSTEFDLE